MPSKSDKIIKFNWTPRETRWINAVLIEYILIMDKKSACGGLFRNSKAEVMGEGRGSKSVQVQSTFEAELMGVKHTIDITKQKGWRAT